MPRNSRSLCVKASSSWARHTVNPGCTCRSASVWRLLDEDGRTIGPNRFFSAANRYQMMPEIDRWVINQAIELLKPQAELLAGHTVSFAINFSGQSLNDEGFVDFLLERIRSSGIDPGVFCFELTENATIANIARAEALMRGLRDLGCGVALDDFGTG